MLPGKSIYYLEKIYITWKKYILPGKRSSMTILASEICKFSQI